MEGGGASRKEGAGVRGAGRKELVLEEAERIRKEMVVKGAWMN